MLDKDVDRNYKGYVTLKGIYELYEDEFKKEYEEKKRIHGNFKTHKKYKTLYNRFRAIVLCYLKYCITDTINGLTGIEWYIGFGKLQMISFVSGVRSYTFRVINGKRERTILDKEPYEGVFSYMIWKSNKKGRMYRYKIKLSSKFKSLIGKKKNEGMEYLSLEYVCK